MALNQSELRAYERLIRAFLSWEQANAPFSANTTNYTLLEAWTLFQRSIKFNQEFTRSKIGQSGVTCGWCGERKPIEHVKKCQKEQAIKLEADREAAIDWLTNLLKDEDDREENPGEASD